VSVLTNFGHGYVSHWAWSFTPTSSYEHRLYDCTLAYSTQYLSPASPSCGKLPDVGCRGAAWGLALLISRKARFSKLKFLIMRVTLEPMLETSTHRGHASSSYKLQLYHQTQPARYCPRLADSTVDSPNGFVFCFLKCYY